MLIFPASCHTTDTLYLCSTTLNQFDSMTSVQRNNMIEELTKA